jgi:hypothetical protein
VIEEEFQQPWLYEQWWKSNSETIHPTFNLLYSYKRKQKKEKMEKRIKKKNISSKNVPSYVETPIIKPFSTFSNIHSEYSIEIRGLCLNLNENDQLININEKLMDLPEDIINSLEEKTSYIIDPTNPLNNKDIFTSISPTSNIFDKVVFNDE